MVTRREVNLILAGMGLATAKPVLANEQTTEEAPGPGSNSLRADDVPILKVPPREIPSPSYLSRAEQIALATPWPPRPPYPRFDDIAQWRALVKSRGPLIDRSVQEMAARVPPSKVSEIDAGGAHVYVVEPHETLMPDRAVALYAHGGALIYCGGKASGDLGRVFAGRYGINTWSIDYRMPPDHPYPAGLDDCVAAYRTLLRQRRPEEIIIGGESAGGNLAAALLLRARDEGLPMPAAAVLITPEIDLTEQGDSFYANLGIDPMGSLMGINRLYAGRQDLRDPYLSPLFGHFSGFPPTLLTAGTRDMFLSNSVRMHRSLRDTGVYSELHIVEARTHVGPLPDSPDDLSLRREVRRFIRAALTAPDARVRALELTPER